MRLITLRYADSLGGLDDRPLNDFLRDKEVIAVRDHFFVVHDVPHLACLVTYATPPNTADPKQESAPARRRRADPTADLAPELRPLFDTLREWRSARARKDGVPPYVVLTNRQLVALVETRPQTLSAIAAIDGVGKAKIERQDVPCAEPAAGSGEAAVPGAP